MNQAQQAQQARIIVAEAVAMQRKPNKQDVVERIAFALNCTTDRATSRLNQIARTAGLTI